MKAAIVTRYGAPEVVEIQEVEKPTPKDGEILVQVRATTVASADWRIRSQSLPKGFGPMAQLIFGFGKPRNPILGTELSGTVEAVGKDVRKFKVGDAVVVFSDAKMQSHAEYKVAPENGAVVLKPSRLSFDEAAALAFGGTTALTFLRKAKIQVGQKILINGASGAVGTSAVQLAKHMGAHVTTVCSAKNLDLMRGLGADHTIDYTATDLAKASDVYDVVMDCVGTLPFAKAKHLIKKGGAFLMISGTLPEMLGAPWAAVTSGRKIMSGVAMGSVEQLEILAKLAEAGKYKPVIDRTYPFAQIVEAHRHVDQGHKRGSVVVAVS